MAEDVAAQMRLGVEIASLGSLLSMIAVLLCIGLNVFQNFEMKTIRAVQAISIAPLYDIQNQESVTSANIYKVLMSANINIESIKIFKSDGSLDTEYVNVEDFIKLLYNASKHYTVEVFKSAGSYSIELTEVL
ncbi:MAG: hypothetical protein IJE43_19095 [Alphaproteobacteria bacterium]|nr:hypothetical protein [Alphaproteobacteria bacterium]